MAESTTPRMTLKKQSAGTDAWPGRVGFMEMIDDLELLTAIDVQVANIGARPAAGVRGRYCWVESDSEIGFKPSLWRDSGTAWTRIWPARNVPERAVIQFGPDASNNPVNVPSVGWYPAGREIKFAYASGGQVYTDGDIGEELTGGDVIPITANLWRPNAPLWITDFIDDPADASGRPGLITIGEVGLYEIHVAITLSSDSPAAGYWAAGVTATRFGADASGPTFSGIPFNAGDASARAVALASSRFASLEVGMTVVLDDPNNPLEVLPFLHFGSTSVSSGQRQFVTCTVTITRWPGVV